MATQPLLQLHNVHAGTSTQTLLHGLSLTVNPGELHLLTGPNGAGKSTMASLLAGNPHYLLQEGSMHLQGQDLATIAPEARAATGLFIAFQHPVALPGVSTFNFLKTALTCLYEARKQTPPPLAQILKTIRNKADELNIDHAMLSRDLNDDFSGGEQKRMELLQLAVLDPKVAILDELDSGLDIDGLRTLGTTIQKLRKADNAFIVITHYPHLLQYLKPDAVHILHQGRIVRQGKEELTNALLEGGYEAVLN